MPRQQLCRGEQQWARLRQQTGPAAASVLEASGLMAVATAEFSTAPPRQQLSCTVQHQARLMQQTGCAESIGAAAAMSPKAVTKIETVEAIMVVLLEIEGTGLVANSPMG